MLACKSAKRKAEGSNGGWMKLFGLTAGKNQHRVHVRLRAQLLHADPLSSASKLVQAGFQYKKTCRRADS